MVSKHADLTLVVRFICLPNCRGWARWKRTPGDSASASRIWTLLCQSSLDVVSTTKKRSACRILLTHLLSRSNVESTDSHSIAVKICHAESTPRYRMVRSYHPTRLGSREHRVLRTRPILYFLTRCGAEFVTALISSVLARSSNRSPRANQAR